MVDDFKIIGPKVQNIRDSFIDTRNQLKKKYSLSAKDARLTVFNKCTRVMGAVLVGTVLMDKYVVKPTWWMTNLTTKYNKNEAKRTATSLNEFFFIGLTYFVIISVESSFRLYVKALDPSACNNGTAEFESIYEWLLKRLKLKKHHDLLNLLRHIRNTQHNNGYFYPPNGQNADAPYKGKVYKFVVGKVAKFLTWDFVLKLLPDVKEMLKDIVEGLQHQKIPNNIIKELT